jgi:hypothetical protein
VLVHCRRRRAGGEFGGRRREEGRAAAGAGVLAGEHIVHLQRRRGVGLHGRQVVAAVGVRCVVVLQVG